MRFIFLRQIAPVSETGKHILQPLIKNNGGGKHMGRDKEDLLILGGSIYGNAFLHFIALSLKMGFSATLFYWGYESELRAAITPVDCWGWF